MYVCTYAVRQLSSTLLRPMNQHNINWWSRHHSSVVAGRWSLYGRSLLAGRRSLVTSPGHFWQLVDHFPQLAGRFSQVAGHFSQLATRYIAYRNQNSITDMYVKCQLICVLTAHIYGVEKATSGALLLMCLPHSQDSGATSSSVKGLWDRLQVVSSFYTLYLP